jgi:hypothetical protein
MDRFPVPNEPRRPQRPSRRQSPLNIYRSRSSYSCLSIQSNCLFHRIIWSKNTMKKHLIIVGILVTFLISPLDVSYAQLCGPGRPNCPAGKYCATTRNGYECLASTPRPPTGGQGVDIGLWFHQGVSGQNTSSIGGFVTNLLPQVFVIALILTLIYIIWGSYTYLTSQGDPKAIDAAKRHLTWAIIGMIIISLSFGMFQLVNSLLYNIF